MKDRQIESNLIPRLATGFCSGMARTGGMCGAISGGILAISLIHGRDNPEQDVTPSYDRIQDLLYQFEQKFGAINCYDLIQCDLRTEEGQTKFSDENLSRQCQDYVESVAKMISSMINSPETSSP